MSSSPAPEKCQLVTHNLSGSVERDARTVTVLVERLNGKFALRAVGAWRWDNAEKGTYIISSHKKTVSTKV